MASIKDTNYAVPSEAYFVSINGKDTNSGKQQSSPWRTINKAITSAPNGSTIVIRGGIYRESLINLNKKLTVQPYPHEKVWIKGSVEVTGWVADGSNWRKDNWTHKFDFIPASSPEIDDAYPQAGYLEMVFVNGQRLAQVLNKWEVTSGKFYVDRTHSQLYIGTNPSGKTVEVTTIERGMNVNTAAAGSAIKGLGFCHYAEKAIHINSPNILIENNTFAWNGFNGVSFTSTDSRVNGNIFTYNGNKGLNGSRAHRTVVENNVFSYNNIENFAKNHSAAGSKFSNTSDLVLRDNICEHNNATGLWVDISCTDTTIVRNICRHNKADGIFFEISHRAIIASNLCHDNDGVGIKVLNSTSTQVINNTLSKNGINLTVADTTRANTNSAESKVGITWQTADVVVKNNLFSNIEGTVEGWFPLMVNIYAETDIPGRKLIADMNNNGYYRTSANSPETIVRYKPTPANQGLRCETVADFSAKTGFDKNAVVVDNVATNPFFVDQAKGNYQLKSGSPAKGVGAPLPTSVASAIGVQAGVKVNIGALDPAGPGAGALR